MQVLLRQALTDADCQLPTIDCRLLAARLRAAVVVVGRVMRHSYIDRFRRRRLPKLNTYFSFFTQRQRQQRRRRRRRWRRRQRREKKNRIRFVCLFDRREFEKLVACGGRIHRARTTNIYIDLCVCANRQPTSSAQ